MELLISDRNRPCSIVNLLLHPPTLPEFIKCPVWLATVLIFGLKIWREVYKPSTQNNMLLWLIQWLDPLQLTIKSVKVTSTLVTDARDHLSWLQFEDVGDRLFTKISHQHNDSVNNFFRMSHHNVANMTLSWTSL